MNFCKDCKHFKKDEHYMWYQPATCTYKATIQFDPVFGIKKVSGTLFKCRDYRAEISHIENKCGPEGKHFEAKD